MGSAESMGAPRPSTPQRCSVDSSVYRQCLLEECSTAYHHGVSKLESDHRDVTGRSRFHHYTQCRSIPLSMSTVHRIIGDENTRGFQPRENEVIDTLWTFHSATNGV
ncbi:hypothetical protein TNCV_4567041 [Trichonephila clavipes]|nr:hypothetical protein TNCV_4567041 [Trichonephila clavipes]